LLYIKKFILFLGRQNLHREVCYDEQNATRGVKIAGGKKKTR
jgi:hypothetical protein